MTTATLKRRLVAGGYEVGVERAHSNELTLFGKLEETLGRHEVSLRLDQEIVARFKASGPGWQTRMNDALREAVGL